MLYFINKVYNKILTNTVHQITLKKQKNEYLKKSEPGKKLITRPARKIESNKDIQNDTTRMILTLSTKLHLI